MGYCFFLNSAIVLWSNKKQKTILTLMTKAEYIAISYAIREKIWIKRFINKLLLKIIKFCLKSNNKASFSLIKNLKS